MTTAEVPAPTGTERRIAPRRQPAMGTVLRLDAADGGTELALVWNISRSGVSMLLHEPRPQGERLAGLLDSVTEDHCLPVRMRVIHVRELETGDYVLGAHFDRPLTEEELTPFVS
jgi:hypothetical protein